MKRFLLSILVVVIELSAFSQPPGTFTSTFVKTTIPEDGLFISDNKFWYSAGKSTAKAFRCWFELGAVLDKETNFEARVIFKFDDETSGIATVKRTELQWVCLSYNL